MNVKRVLGEKRGIVIPLALAIVANVLLYALVVFPLGHQVASAQNEAQTAHAELYKARNDAASAKATVAGKQQADAALSKFYKDVLPADQSIARRLTYTRLSELAKQANVHLASGTNSVKHEKASTLSKLTTVYTLTGGYRDVRRFIYSLETAPEFIVLENLALSSANDQQNDKGLSVKLDIATYFRSGDVGE